MYIDVITDIDTFWAVVIILLTLLLIDYGSLGLDTARACTLSVNEVKIY